MLKQQFRKSTVQFLGHNMGISSPELHQRRIHLPQIQRYYRYFGKDQSLLLESDEFVTQAIRNLNRLLNFLRSPAVDCSYLNHQIRNQCPNRMKIVFYTELFLKNFYHPYNEELLD